MKYVIYAFSVEVPGCYYIMECDGVCFRTTTDLKNALLFDTENKARNYQQRNPIPPYSIKAVDTKEIFKAKLQDKELII